MSGKQEALPPPEMHHVRPWHAERLTLGREGWRGAGTESGATGGAQWFPNGRRRGHQREEGANRARPQSDPGSSVVCHSADLGLSTTVPALWPCL